MAKISLLKYSNRFSPVLAQKFQMVAVLDYTLLKQRKKVCFQPVAVSPPIPQGGNNHLTQIRGNQTMVHSWENTHPWLGGEPQEGEMRGGRR